MRKRAILSPTLRLLLGGFMLLGLFGCGAKTEDTDTPVSNDNTEDEKDTYPTNEAKELYAENVLDVFAWIGRPIDEIDISDEYVDGSRGISFTGSLFGHTVEYGCVSFLTDYESGQKVADHIYCSCADLSFDDAEKEFINVYGRPYEIGEEPYVAVNGGAVSWERFYADTGTVQLSHPSEWDIIYIDVTPNTLPKKNICTIDELNGQTGYGFSFEDSGFEDIVCGYTDYMETDIYSISYLYQDIPYHLDIIVDCEELPESYLRQMAILQSDTCIEADDDMIFLSEKGDGAIVRHEYFGRDIWVIYMGDSATEDKLLEMESILQTAWDKEG